MIQRNLAEILSRSKKSILLLGPRQVGKSTLVAALSPDLTINLAKENVYLDYSANPSLLESVIAAREVRTVFIDEVQRLPSLMNTIQALIDENRSLRFFLTGSSARKLKRGNANLLPGRVILHRMGPLVASELEYEIDSEKALSIGTLPEIYGCADSREARSILKSYAATYLKEEIQAEALTKNIEGFSRFLLSSVAWAGGFLDLSKLSNTAKVPRQTTLRFLEILEDTLLVRRLWPHPDLLASADLIKHPKLYFFDCGVINSLLGGFEVSQDRRGLLFEHLICSQIIASADSKDLDCQLHSFRTRGGLEVDFLAEIEGKKFAIEVKATQRLTKDDFSALKKARSYLGKGWQPCIAYLGNTPRMTDGITAYPWQDLLRKMGL